MCVCVCVCLARCDTLCTPGFIDDVIFAHNGPYGGMSVRLQRVTSLRQGRACCVTASYWLRRVLDDDGSGGGVSETDQCTIAVTQMTLTSLCCKLS